MANPISKDYLLQQLQNFNKDILQNEFTSVDDKKITTSKTWSSEKISSLINDNNGIINSDFSINQRMDSSYSKTGGYTFDGWWIGAYSSVSENSTYGLQIYSSVGAPDTSYSLIRQNVANYKDYEGKTCTVSVNVSRLTSVGAKILIMTLVGKTKSFPVSKPITKAGIVQQTFTLPSNLDGLSVIIYGSDLRVPGEIDANSTYVRWVKLEIGDVATPYVKPIYPIEMIKCQNLYQQIKASSDSAFGVAMATSATTARMSLILPTSMRTTPTINTTDIANHLALFTTSSNSHDITDIAVDSLYGNVLNLTLTSTGLTAKQGYYVKSLFTGYGIIKLSAEMPNV